MSRSRLLRACVRAVLLLAPLATALPAAEAGGLRDMRRAHRGAGAGSLDFLVYFQAKEGEPPFTAAEMTCWESVMRRYSELLHDATEGQLRVRRFRFSTYLSDQPNADVVVTRNVRADGLPEGAHASARGFTRRGHAITLSAQHRATGEAGSSRCSAAPPSLGLSDDVLGQFSLLHESGHYLFNLDDEYLGTVLEKATGKETDVCDNAVMFCSHCDGISTSVMDGGGSITGNNKRREFCARRVAGQSCSAAGAVAGDVGHRGPVTQTTSFLSSPSPKCIEDKLTRVTMTGEFRNRQEKLHAASCWETMAQMRYRDGGTPQPFEYEPSLFRLDYPVQGVRANGPPPDAPTIVRTTGDMAMLLLVDTSSSMAARVQEARKLARELVGLLRDDEHVGIALFDFDLARSPNGDLYPLPISPVKDVRGRIDQIFDAIDTTQGGGWTNLGGALAEGIEALRGDPLVPAHAGRYAGRNLVLLTDGKHTLGRRPGTLLTRWDTPDSTSTVLEGEQVHVVRFLDAQGQVDADLAQVEQDSGGQSGWVVGEDCYASVAWRAPFLLKAARNTKLVYGMCPTAIAPGAVRSDSFPIAAAADAAELSLSREDQAPLALVVRSPAGGRVYDSRLAADAAAFTITAGHIAFRVTGTDVVAGRWSFDVVSLRTNGPSDLYQVIATTQIPGVDAVARIGGPSLVRYPAPVHLEMTVRDGTGVVGASVLARVFHPGTGAIEETISLLDDGLAEHGDATAEDGVYSALFSGYRTAFEGGGSGVYRFLMTATNVDGTRAYAGEDGPVRAGGGRVAPFTLLDVAYATVVDIPDTLTPGQLTVLPPLVAEQRLLPAESLNVTPVMRFRLATSGEMVRLLALTISSVGSGREDLLDEVGLYLDENGDGRVENPHAPLATGIFSDDDGQVLFQAPGALAMLSPGETNFIVTFGRLQGETPATVPPIWHGPRPPPALRLPLSPLLFAALAGVLGLAILQRRRRVASIAVTGAVFALAFLVTGALGCGGPTTSIGDPPFPPGSPTDHPLKGLYNLSLVPADVIVEGVTTRVPIFADDPPTGPATLGAQLELE